MFAPTCAQTWRVAGPYGPSCRTNFLERFQIMLVLYRFHESWHILVIPAIHRFPPHWIPLAQSTGTRPELRPQELARTNKCPIWVDWQATKHPTTSTSARNSGAFIAGDYILFSSPFEGLISSQLPGDMQSRRLWNACDSTLTIRNGVAYAIYCL